MAIATPNDGIGTSCEGDYAQGDSLSNTLVRISSNTPDFSGLPMNSLAAALVIIWELRSIATVPRQHPLRTRPWVWDRNGT